MKEKIKRMNDALEQARELLARSEIEEAMAKLALVQAYIDSVSYTQINDCMFEQVRNISVVHDSLVARAEILLDRINGRE